MARTTRSKPGGENPRNSFIRGLINYCRLFSKNKNPDTRIEAAQWEKKFQAELDGKAGN